MTDASPEATWIGDEIDLGTKHTTSIVISESYAGVDVRIPVHIWRARVDGPTVCIAAAVHGDEINGTGTIRKIIREEPFELQAGTLVFVPVVNLLGFERHSRYLPDRRDLNRAFPGSRTGTVAARLAHVFFNQVIQHCDYCIDLHTAAVRRTNFPNVRADLNDERLASFARAFGTELIISGKGPKGSLRYAANKAGCATLTLEAGEVWKVEPGIVEYSVRGIRNCLQHLGMVAGEPAQPAYRVETELTKWIRAQHGGFLEYHVAPGDIVMKGDPIATNTSLLGEVEREITAPRGCIVVGLTTLPSVAPGDPICHIAYPKRGVVTRLERLVDALDDDSLHERVRDDLARSVMVEESDDAESTSSDQP